MSYSAPAKRHNESAVSLDDTDQGISPGEIFRMLWSHKLFILACALLCFLLALVYVVLKHPVYEATAIVRLDPGRTGSLGLSDLGSGGPVDTGDLIHTEIAIIESDGVALGTLRALPADEFAALTGEKKSEANLPESLSDLTPDQADLLDAIQLPLVAKQEEGTSLINVSFRNGNAKIAADVANTLVSAYLVQSFTGRNRSVTQLNGWLSSQMETLKNQVDTSQRKLTAFEEKNNVISTGGNSNSIADRLRLLSDRLTGAQGDRIVKEGQLRAAQTGDLNVLAALFPTSRLQALQGEQATISTRYQQLHSKFGASYPPLVEAKKQVDVINGVITEEIQAIRSRLQQEYSAARTTQDLLQHEYDEQTKLAFAFDRHEAEYAALQAEVTSSRELYDTLRKKVQQAGIDAQVNGLNTIPVDSARTPSFPVAPKKLLILGASVLLGLFAGIAASFVLESKSDKLRSLTELGKVAPYEVLSTIPAGRKRSTPNDGAPLTVMEAGASGRAGAYRALRDYLLLKGSEGVRSLLFSAASREEPTNEVIANLAVGLAQANKRVLLIDADFQQPSLHRYFALDNGTGLSDLLNGATTNPYHVLSQHSGLELLTAGTLEPEAARDLIQEPFEVVLRKWQEQFEYVLIKVGPLMEQSSGLLLAHWLQGVILTVSYHSTRLQTLRELHPLLKRADANVLGIVVDNASQT